MVDCRAQILIVIAMTLLEVTFPPNTNINVFAAQTYNDHLIIRTGKKYGPENDPRLLLAPERLRERRSDESSESDQSNEFSGRGAELDQVAVESLALPPFVLVPTQELISIGLRRRQALQLQHRRMEEQKLHQLLSYLAKLGKGTSPKPNPGTGASGSQAQPQEPTNPFVDPGIINWFQTPLGDMFF